MSVAIGLRNPGPEYAGTRHNIGYEVIQRVARRQGGRFKRGPSRVRSEVAEVGDADVVDLENEDGVFATLHAAALVVIGGDDVNRDVADGRRNLLPVFSTWC